MENTNNKNLFVLLTANSDFVSKVFQLLTGSTYTHASIGTENPEHLFYSFVVKDGFRVERPTYSKKEKKLRRKCALLRISVSEEDYVKVMRTINSFNENAERYRYSLLGVVMCLMKIPYKGKYDYICTRFVAELLESVNKKVLSKEPSLYLPDEFMKLPELKICYEGVVKGLEEAIGISREQRCLSDTAVFLLWNNIFIPDIH